MKKILLLLLITVPLLSVAQSVPYAWTFTAKKTADRTYEIHCSVDLTSPWHTYSQFTPEGGPVPTKFIFSKNPLCTTDGGVKENGKMITKHEDVFGIDVKYFEGSVDFVQKVKLKSGAKTNYSGTVTFMVCNDTECLPPVTQKFSLSLN